MKLCKQSERALKYLAKIPITQWQNTQWITTRKFPILQRLPAHYGIVTSNMSDLTNFMIDELQCEGWTELLEGALCHMVQKISDKRQEYVSK